MVKPDKNKHTYIHRGHERRTDNHHINMDVISNYYKDDNSNDIGIEKSLNGLRYNAKNSDYNPSIIVEPCNDVTSEVEENINHIITKNSPKDYEVFRISRGGLIRHYYSIGYKVVETLIYSLELKVFITLADQIVICI